MIFTAPDEKIWLGVLRIEIEIPWSHSLKQKRGQLNRIKDRFRSKSNLSVAEVGYLDNHKRSVLSIVMTGNEARPIESSLDKYSKMLHSLIDGNVISLHKKLFPYSPEFP